jgi:hypothetical protein
MFVKADMPHMLGLETIRFSDGKDYYDLKFDGTGAYKESARCEDGAQQNSVDALKKGAKFSEVWAFSP